MRVQLILMQCGEHRTAISSSSVVITYGQKSIFWKFDSHHGTRFLPFLDIMIQINSEKNDGTKWGNILICIRRKWLLWNEAYIPKEQRHSLEYAHWKKIISFFPSSKYPIGGTFWNQELPDIAVMIVSLNVYILVIPNT